MSVHSLLKTGAKLWSRLTEMLIFLQAPASLGAGYYVAHAFFLSGLTKLSDWDTTLALFADEYHVPLLSPHVAATMGTTAKSRCPSCFSCAWAADSPRWDCRWSMSSPS